MVPAVVSQLVLSLAYLGKVLYSTNGSVHVVGPATLNSKALVGLFASCMFVSAGVDILIAIFLTYYLTTHRRAGFKSTVHVLQRLTVLAVNSGIWTAAFALLTAILLQVLPTTMLFNAIGMPLCGMYSNTLLANLNSRKYIRFVTSGDVGMDILSGTRSDTRGDEYALGDRQV